MPLTPPGPRCAITGAADGIGRALAFELGRAGHAVVGLDVDAERARETAAALAAEGIDASFVVADLATPEGLVAARAGLAQGAPFDVFVHNAGISCVGPFATTSMERQRAVLELNLTAPLVLTPWLLKEERIAAGGALVFVSSLSRFVGYPGAAVYAASKDGLASYARSLAVALAPHGLSVLTVYPGPTRTAHARRYAPPGASAASEARRMPPEALARSVRRAVERRRRVLVPGAGARLAALFGTAFPRTAERVMRRALFEPLVGPPGRAAGG